MNSVFAAATLACVSQALRLQGEDPSSKVVYTTKGDQCHFPFKNTYDKGQIENFCTYDGDSHGSWCFVKNSSGGQSKKWGYCDLPKVFTHGGTAPEGSQCSFPSINGFVDQDQSCMRDGSTSGKAWCYVKNSEGGISDKWGYCLQKEVIPPKPTPEEPAPSSDDKHAGPTFEQSLESEEKHLEWRTHQVEHQTENAHLASERGARTSEYFAALAASHGADAAVVHATAQEKAAEATLHTATANAADADAKWTGADRELHQATEELAGARKAMEAARAHHAKVIGDAHGAQDAAEKKHSGLVADASDELAKATAAEGAAHSAKTHAEDVAKTAHEAHVAANAAMEAANHASHQANDHYGASKAAAMAAHHAYVEAVNMGATNGYIH